MTLVEMFEKAQEDGCLGGDSCTNPEEHLHIGDYVDFKNPTSGSVTVEADEVGLDRWSKSELDSSDKSQTYTISSTKNQLNWRVLGIDKDTGGIKLISGRPLKSDNTVNGGTESPYLYMYGAKSYLNAEKVLDGICSTLYEGQEYVADARSVDMEDINEIAGIETEEDIKRVNLDPYSGGLQYGETYNTSSANAGREYTPEGYLNGDPGSSISVEVDGYYYAINADSGDAPVTATVSNQRAYDLLFDNVDYPNGAQYWLASCGVRAYPNVAYFGPGVVRTDDGGTGAGTNSMFGSYGDEIVVDAAVRPVVCLKSEVSSDQVQKIDDKKETDWNYNISG